MTVLVPKSICGLIQDCTRLGHHFDLIRSSREENNTPLIPPLSKFVEVNPFEVACKSVDLAPPKNLSCCGGDEEQPPPTKKNCC